MGESWHNNHHAFPGSARLGLYEKQSDPGWWVLNRLMNIGLVWNVKLPQDLEYRPELEKLNNQSVLLKRKRKLPKKCSVVSYMDRLLN